MRIVLVVCAIALTACSPRPVEPTASTTAPTTSTASTPDLVQAMDAKVKAALMPPDAFDHADGEFLGDKPELDAELPNTDGKLSSVCLGARVDSGVSASRRRLWNAPVALEEAVFGLVGVTGSHVIDTVRAKARSCQTYVGKINKPVRVVKPDVELPGLQDAEDSYAFCQSLPDVAEPAWAAKPSSCAET